MNSIKLKLSVLSLLTVGILVGRFSIFTRSFAEQFIVNWGYWVMLLGVFVYVALFSRFLLERLSKQVWQKYRIGVAVAFLGALFLQLHEPRQFKVLYDEHTLSGVARNMHFLREASFPGRAHLVDDRFEVFQVGVDKRPLLFQFALSCVHDLAGYRPENVFVLNGVAAFFMLLLMYYFGAQYGGWRLGVTCIALWLSLPLLAQCATSGGYDVFNLFMLALLWFFGREYLRAPGLLSQSLFVLTAVHLAQVRQESIIYVTLMAVVVLWQWVRQRKIQLGWIATLSPLYVVLPLAVNLVFMRTPSSFESGAANSFFSLAYLPDNLQRAVWYLFNFDLGSTNSVILSTVGAISVVGFVVKSLFSGRAFFEAHEDVLLFLFVLYVSVGTTLVLSNFWGQWDDPTATRFSLPLHLLFVLCVGRLAKESYLIRPLSSWVPVCALVLAVVLSSPSAAKALATRNLWSGREYSWFLNQLDEPRYRDVLVIAPPGGAILYNHAAIGLDVAEAAKWKINECLRNGLYREIVVLERFIVDSKTLKERPYDTEKTWEMNIAEGHAQAGGALSASFRKEMISEMRMRPNVISRISRVVSVEGPDAVPPREYIEQRPPFASAADQLKHIYLALP